MTAITADPPLRCDECGKRLTVRTGRWLRSTLTNEVWPICVACCVEVMKEPGFTSRWMFRKRDRDRYDGGAS